MEVAQSVSQVLVLQHLLEQNNVVELFEGFSEAQWNIQEQENNGTENQEGSSACDIDIDQYIPYFCGTLRKSASSVLKSIFNHSCTCRQG